MDEHDLGEGRGGMRRRTLLLGGAIGLVTSAAACTVDDDRPPPAPGRSALDLESSAAVARAIGWAIVTDPRWAGGAVGDGKADDTAAVRAAAATGRTVFFPAGVYRGAFDLDVASPRLLGAGRNDVTILVEDGHFLVDSNQKWSMTRVEQLTVTGGQGALRNRYAKDNVTSPHVVLDCAFYDYTGTAISTDSGDMPLWRIERCVFRAADHATAMGIALNGLTDTNTVQRCEFQSNLVHIKLGHGGNNTYVSNNDFVQYAPPEDGVRRTVVWVVPAREPTNSGAGLTISDNKFGNENQGQSDLRIAYADEGPGDHFGDRLPDYGSDSTGYITGHTIRGGLVAGAVRLPVIYSTTPFTQGCTVTNVVFAGSLPSYVFQLRTPTDATNPEAYSNSAGPFHLTDQNFAPFPVANQPAMFRVDDPHQMMDTWAGNPLSARGGGNAAGYVDLLLPRTGDLDLRGGTTQASVRDALGGREAVEVSLAPGGAVVGVPPRGALQADYPVWIEFDLAAGVSSSVEELYVSLGLDDAPSGGPGQYFRRRLRPTDEWRPYRFLTAVPRSSDSVVLAFEPTARGTGDRVRLGRVRMYHAREPVPADLVLPKVTTSERAPGPGTADPLPARPTGYLTVYIGAVPRQVAYY
jgi:hypothetical protein